MRLGELIDTLIAVYEDIDPIDEKFNNYEVLLVARPLSTVLGRVETNHALGVVELRDKA